MKVEIEVPRTFDITLKQMDEFLTGSGWSEKQNHNELTCKYQCIKYPNVFVVLPKAEGKVVDEKNMMFSALRLIANMNNNCGIETIVNRVLGEHKRNEPLNKRSNKGDENMEGDLRIWCIPQIPLKEGDEPFYVGVDSPKEGKLVLDALARYDIYQFEHNIKPDHSNAGVLEIEDDDGKWNEWEMNGDDV
ncbi:MAG: hypothetical protein KAJ39_02215 [Gammaproteobacteria bacterium]|nr:hypothetical protein [Gammaproteobacteria bacterium]